MSSQRVLITGAAGWLGQFMYQSLEHSEWEVYGAYHDRVPLWIPESNRLILDLSSVASIEECFKKVSPDIVIHLAALSSPASCEKNPAQAYAVNCPEALTNTIKRIKPSTFLLYTSTDLVFDGEKGSLYSPSDVAQPATMYGITKLAFEKHVTELDRGIVIRLSNMIGPRFAYEAVGTKFMEFLFDSLSKRSYIGLRDDEIRSFVYVKDVVDLIKCIMVTVSADRDLVQLTSRIFHAGGPRGLSRLNMAEILARSSPECELVVHDKQQEYLEDDSGSNIWRVFRISNAVSIQSSGINNPRDVSMNSTLTETTFKLRFSDMESIVPTIISSFKL